MGRGNPRPVRARTPHDMTSRSPVGSADAAGPDDRRFRFGLRGLCVLLLGLWLVSGGPPRPDSRGLGEESVRGPLPADYFPLAVGNRWHYESSEGDSFSPVTETWRIVERRGRDYVLEIRQSLLAGELPSELVSVSSAGVAVQPRAGAPVAFLIKSPVRLGTTWETAAGRFEITELSESVVVPAGVFEDCLKIRFRAHNGQAAAVTLYAPGVGMVQRDESFTIFGGLGSAELGSSPPSSPSAKSPADGPRLGRVSLWLSEWERATPNRDE